MTALTRRALAALDAGDPLAGFRRAFALPKGVIYLDGNSLGPLPRDAARRLNEVVRRQWGDDLILSWNRHQWIDWPARVGDKIARLIGATLGEVVVADSTSINLFKLLAGALRARPKRSVILSEQGNFPTDLYVAQGLTELLGGRHELRLAASEEITASIDEDVAVIMLTHVDYRSGAMHDMAAVNAAGHAKGALMLWDLSHSAGAVPLDMRAAGTDLAVGCGCKYLNGGPGAPAFLFVAERLQDGLHQPITGWMGHAEPFAFAPDYRPVTGISRNLVGTPPILALAALETGVYVLLRADPSALREKSLALTDLFMRLVEQECPGHGFTIATPRETATRASQVALRHDEGLPIMQALIEAGVIGDFRAPDLLRFGFAPLYNRYTDVWDAVAALSEIMRTRAWDSPAFRRRAVVT